RLARLGVDVRLGTPAAAAALAAGGFDEVIVATGVTPRIPAIDGVDHPMVMTYADVLAGRRVPGARVAVIGAGGIGFDVAEYLLGDAKETTDPEAFLRAWSIDPVIAAPGGLAGRPRADVPRPVRQVTLFQRKPGRPGTTLGKSTGWILKARLRQAGLRTVSGAVYTRITDQGLHYSADGQAAQLQVDSVVLCAGQESERTLFRELGQLGITARLIGGADVAAELDAVRAIDQATRLAAVI
ncbi:MAG TPA: FAD-dependent oxidoreductase, partial [Trebonia sp.]|nr:FAD-dependent oxidoreductase [Trebonia sp.]